MVILVSVTSEHNFIFVLIGKNLKLHKFATTKMQFFKVVPFRHALLYDVPTC